MSFFPAAASLLLTLLALSTYRYGFIAQLLDGDGGYSGMTLFSILLFLPSLTAFLWKRAGEDKRVVWGAALATGLLFLATSLSAHPFSRLIVLSNALAFGFAEAWLVPAVQRYFHRAGGAWLSWGMAAVFAISGFSVLVSPVLYDLLGATRLSWSSFVAAFGLSFLIFHLLRASDSPTESNPSNPASEDSGMTPSQATAAVLFLTGLGFGSMANMVYPIALKMLHLGPVGVGLYACLPLVSFSAGSALQGVAGRRWRLESALACLILPILFFSGRINIFLVLLAWGASLSFAEVAALYGQKNFHRALSLKYLGIVFGILVTGAIANAGIASPFGATALSFYVVGSIGGLFLWAKSWSISTTPARRASLSL